MKKILLLLIALAASVAAWAWDGSGTQADPYLIKTTDDLVTLATNSASNNYFTNNGYKSPYNTPACGGTISRSWNDKYYLEPIPSAQITLDPNLGQNPGW